jgi:tetratricopeptide (TPR) repeat protein
MVTLATRLVLLAIFTSIGLLLVQKGDKSYWFYFTADILIVLDYLRSGSMWPAYQAFKLQDYKGLRRRLRETLFPFLLSKTHKAKYHYLKGAAEIHREHFDEAEKHFKLALSQRKTSPTDKGMIYGFLASIALHRGDKKAALAYLDKANQEGDSPALKQIEDNIRKKIGNFQ